MSRIKNRRKLVILMTLALLVGLLALSPVRAADIKGGDHVVVGPGEVIDDDLYAFAATITIEGTVKGDVVAAGGQVIVKGKVEGDLTAAGQGVVISGTVQDDARIAGQALRLGPEAQVTDDLVAAGFSLETQAGSSVGGDLLFGGYQALLAGDIGQDVRAGLSGLELRGTVGGNVDAKVDADMGGLSPTWFMAQSPVRLPEVRPGLKLADTARINGELAYTSKTTGNISPAAQVMGGITRRVPALEEGQEAPAAQPDMIATVLDLVRRLIVLLLAGALLMLFAPAWIRNLADTIQARPLPALGWGVVTFLAFVIAVIVVLVVTIVLAFLFGVLTLGGLMPLIIGPEVLAEAALIISYLIFVSYIAQVVVSFLGGRWLLERIRPETATGRVWPLVIGLSLLVILTAIPILGALVGLIVVLLGLGAAWLWGRAKLEPVLERV